MVAGLVGGFVGSWTMNQFQSLYRKVEESFDQEGKKNNDRLDQNAQQTSSKQEEPATAKAAIAISETIFEHKLTKEEKKTAGSAVHFAFGAASGGVYGAIAELAPAVTTGVGLPFATALWLSADEIGVVALGLARPPQEYSFSTHVYSFTAHLVYGITTDLVRRAVLSVI